MTPDLETSWLRLPKNLVHSLWGGGTGLRKLKSPSAGDRGLQEGNLGETGTLPSTAPDYSGKYQLKPLGHGPWHGAHTDPFSHLVSGRPVKAAQKPSQLPNALRHRCGIAVRGPKRSQGCQEPCKAAAPELLPPDYQLCWLG